MEWTIYLMWIFQWVLLHTGVKIKETWSFMNNNLDGFINAIFLSQTLLVWYFTRNRYLIVSFCYLHRTFVCVFDASPLMLHLTCVSCIVFFFAPRGFWLQWVKRWQTSANRGRFTQTCFREQFTENIGIAPSTIPLQLDPSGLQLSKVLLDACGKTKSK